MPFLAIYKAQANAWMSKFFSDYFYHLYVTSMGGNLRSINLVKDSKIIPLPDNGVIHS